MYPVRHKLNEDSYCPMPCNASWHFYFIEGNILIKIAQRYLEPPIDMQLLTKQNKFRFIESTLVGLFGYLGLLIYEKSICLWRNTHDKLLCIYRCYLQTCTCYINNISVNFPFVISVMSSIRV